MRGQLLRITAVILCGSAVGIGWCAGSPRQLGEVVPDEVAATERGGACPTYYCGPVLKSTCFKTNQMYKDANGVLHACKAVPVVVVDVTNRSPAMNSQCLAYCGSGVGPNGPCSQFSTQITTACGTTTGP